jgi:Ca2+:H+ antiporter
MMLNAAGNMNGNMNGMLRQRSRRRILPVLKAVPKMKQNLAVEEIRRQEPVAAASVMHHVNDCQILMHLLLDPINVLLLAAPLGIAASYFGMSHAVVFCLCFLGLIPLAKLLGDATEHLAENMNQTIGGLLNATFGNAAEVIVTVTAINHGLLTIVKESLLGSILSNVLLVLGMSFFAGGITRKEQRFPGAAALINVTMLLVAVMCFALPTIFAFKAPEDAVLKMSRLSAVALMVGYVAFLVFQLFTHVEVFSDEAEGGEDPENGTKGDLRDLGSKAELPVKYVDSDGDRIEFRVNPANQVDYYVNGQLEIRDLRSLYAEGLMLSAQLPGGAQRQSKVKPGEEEVIGRALALVGRRLEETSAPEDEGGALKTPFALGLLLVATILVAIVSEFLVDSLDGLVKEWGVPEAFLGAIVLPIVGNACEHASAIRMAWNNKVATSIAIAVGSSTQVAMLVMPFAVLYAWAIQQPLDFDLGAMGLAILSFSVLVVFSIVMDGKSNWLEGFMLMLAYCIVAVLFWCTPDVD